MSGVRVEWTPPVTPSNTGLSLVSCSWPWHLIGPCLSPNCGLIWGHWGNMMLRVMFPGLCQNIAISRYETRPSINPLNWGHNNCMGHLLLRCRVPFLQLWFSSFCQDIGEPWTVDMWATPGVRWDTWCADQADHPSLSSVTSLTSHWEYELWSVLTKCWLRRYWPLCSSLQNMALFQIVCSVCRDHAGTGDHKQV